MIARRKTLQNSNDDYPKIVDLISRFAIHNTSVSFSCRKHGANRADVHTPTSSSRLDAIRTVYGVTLARDLLQISVSDDSPAPSIFKMDGFISNANYIAKKTTMVLYINGNLGFLLLMVIHVVCNEDGSPFREALPISSNKVVDQEDQVLTISSNLSSVDRSDKNVQFWKKLGGVLHLFLEELMAPPTVATILGFIVGVLPWIKSLESGHDNVIAERKTTGCQSCQEMQVILKPHRIAYQREKKICMEIKKNCFSS